MTTSNSDRALKNSLLSLSPLRSFGSFNKSVSTSGGPRRTPVPTAEDLYKAQPVEVTREKCKAAALGAVVADAAGVCLDRLSGREIEKLVSDEQFQRQPEFLQRDAPKRHRVSRGSLSALGDANLPLLQSLVYHGGLDGPHFTQTSHEFFRQYSGTQSEMFRQFVFAINRGGSFPSGVGVNSIECLTKVPLLVARYAGKPEIALKVRDAVRTHQYGQECISLSIAMARILERVVLGCTILEALSWAQDSTLVDASAKKGIQLVLQSLSVPHTVFVAKQGRSEKLPGAFASCLHAAATASSFQDGIRQTLRAGGACCGRAQLAGALLAAEDCMDAIPQAWIDEVLKFSEYKETVNKLISQRVVVSIVDYSS